MGKSMNRESRALSVRRALWQSAAVLACAAAPAVVLAVPGGPIATLEPGRYVCELPGTAGGPPGRHVEQADFVISSASSYHSAGRSGSYLLTGDSVVFTSGPRKGERFRRITRNTLRVTGADGTESDMRCVHSGR